VADAIRRLSALSGLTAQAPALSGASIVMRQRHPLAMFNLRGTADPAFREAVHCIFGCDLPVAPNSSSACPSGEILKLGPDEWLLAAASETSWSEKAGIPGATLTDVSHARIVIQLDGDRSPDMLVKGCAIDLHPRQFPPGTCVQTSIAKIGVILHRRHNGRGFTLYAARSYAGSLWHWLTAAADEYGYDVVAPQNSSI
jgi:sarcosine oxidase subunit gamma